MTARVFVEARQLTRENGALLWEWADSKPHYGNFTDGLLEVDGLTVWTPEGHVWARFGDWIVKDSGGGFWAVKADEFDASCLVGASEQGSEAAR